MFFRHITKKRTIRFKCTSMYHNWPTRFLRNNFNLPKKMQQTDRKVILCVFGRYVDGTDTNMKVIDPGVQIVRDTTGGPQGLNQSINIYSRHLVTYYFYPTSNHFSLWSVIGKPVFMTDHRYIFSDLVFVSSCIKQGLVQF